MKKGIFKRILPLIIMGIILALSPLFLKVSAASSLDRSSFAFGIASSNENCLFMFNPFDYDNVDNTTYAFLSCSWVDNDGSHSTQMARAKYNETYGYYTLYNPTTYDDYFILYPEEFYVCNFRQYNGHVLDFYVVETVSNFENGTFYFNVGELVGSIPSRYVSSDNPYNISYTVHGGYISRYYLNGSPSFSLAQIGDIINSRFPIQPFIDMMRRFKQHENSSVTSAYNNGYNTGYNEGQSGENAISPFLNLMTGIWGGVDSVLQIEIVPHIKLWYFIAIPLFFIIIWGVLKIWRHN